jgi:uncharacterized delta-60 repeat protein
VVRALALLPDGRILAGGSFITTGPTQYTNLVRLQTNGFPDGTFSAWIGGEVLCLHGYSDGRVLVGGIFSNATFFGSNALLRLLPSGAPDSNFIAPVLGAVHACALLPDSRILISGRFSEVNGEPRNGLARLLPDGQLDPAFDPGIGPDDVVVTLLPLPDGRVLAGGWFSKFNGAPRRGLVLLSSGGSAFLNPAWLPGDGTFAISAQVQPGCPHVLERSADLLSWQSIRTNTPLSSPWEFKDSTIGGPSQRFYRLRRANL